MLLLQLRLRGTAPVPEDRPGLHPLHKVCFLLPRATHWKNFSIWRSKAFNMVGDSP
jgi:hypothetical protein